MLERIAAVVTRWAGGSSAFTFALVLVCVWLLSGPLFHYSENWQLVINTGTTIVTFLMVFLIQRSQNKDSRAMHLKLNELVAATHGASNRLLQIEDLSEEELLVLCEHFRTLSELAGREHDLRKSHSVEEAANRHTAKHAPRQS